jgi:signal transduction histidine kinase
MESIGTLAGGVAHDFNNLLTVIIGNAQLALAKVNAGDPTYESLIEIEKVGRRAADLTGQLLVFSRRQKLDPRTINLNDSLPDFMKMLERIIGANIEVQFESPSNLPLLTADPAQIEQAVMNLAVNARDAMPSGGRITIKAREVTLDEDYCQQDPLAKPGRYVRIEVSDNGSGIDAATKKRIFEPFFSTKEPGKGTGLGLSVVYGVIKQHNGFIEVDSVIGRGTTFTLFVPVVDPGKPTGSDSPIEPGRSRDHTGGRRRRVTSNARGTSTRRFGLSRDVGARRAGGSRDLRATPQPDRPRNSGYGHAPGEWQRSI